jgi:hypothetical protein
MKNATMRVCGKPMLTFSVEYHMSIQDFVVAYLVGSSFQYIDIEKDLATFNSNPTKTVVMEAVKRAVKDYGDDYSYRQDEFPTDWEKLPQIIELTSHLTKLFSF